MLENDTVFPEDVVVVNNTLVQEVCALSLDSVIVVRFRYGVHPLETVKLMYTAVKNCLPDYEVVMIPDDYSLEQMHGDGLIKIKEQINSILESRAEATK